MIFIRGEESWHKQQTSLEKCIKLQLLGSANTFAINTQNVRGMLIDRHAQECSVDDLELGWEAGPGTGGRGGVAGGGVGGVQDLMIIKAIIIIQHDM